MEEIKKKVEQLEAEAGALIESVPPMAKLIEPVMYRRAVMLREQLGVLKKMVADYDNQK